MADTYLSDQLNGLLTLELKYSTRDYLLDTLVAVHHDDEHINRNENENVNVNGQNPNQNQSRYDNNSNNAAAAVVTAVDAATEEIMVTSSTSTASRQRNNKHKRLSIEQQVVNWRKKICEWSYRVVDHFELRRDIVYVAINYLDRYCASFHKNNNEVDVDDDDLDVDNLKVVDVPLLQNKNKFQLVAMASLCLAMKVYGEIEIDTKEETITTESWIIDTVVQLGRGQFTVEQLKLMEIDVLQCLQWFLHPPTPQLFVSYYLNELFLPWNNKDKDDDDDDVDTTTRTMTTMMMSRMTNIELKELTLFIIELSVHDYYFVMNTNKSSVVALAALLNATQLLIDSSSSVSSSSLSSSTMMLMRTMTRARPTTEEENDDYNVEVDDVLSSPSSLSPLSSTWLMDLQQDLFRNHCSSNNSNDYSPGTTTNTCSASSATTCTRTRTTTRMLNAYRERLMKLYRNTDTKIEDFLSNYSTSTSTSTNDDDDDDGMIGNNDDDDGICTTRETSPTSVITKIDQ